MAHIRIDNSLTKREKIFNLKKGGIWQYPVWFSLSSGRGDWNGGYPYVVNTNNGTTRGYATWNIPDKIKGKDGYIVMTNFNLTGQAISADTGSSGGGDRNYEIGAPGFGATITAVYGHRNEWGWKTINSFITNFQNFYLSVGTAAWSSAASGSITLNATDIYFIY